jgi:predicted CopG family antitoxin
MSRQKALVPTIQIRIRQDTYEELVRKGNLADTFDSVIQRLLENDKTQEIA